MSNKSMKVCGVTVLVLLLLFCALGPSKWQVRTGFGWRIDHVVGYFAFTVMFCLAWPRPFAVGGAVVAIALLLEALQAFTPDRHADVYAALISAGGATAAILPADLLFRAPRRLSGRALLRLARMRLLRASRRSLAPKSPALAGLVSQQLQSG